VVRVFTKKMKKESIYDCVTTHTWTESRNVLL
jgi:hypothetical protein